MTILNELTTIKDWIRYAVSRFNEAGLFYGHGTETAWDEAIALVFHCLHLPHNIHSDIIDARILPNERQVILNLITKRTEQRIPLPYLTHEAWFCQLPFYIDERALIPRSPIAELIEQQFSPWIENDRIHRILDLCAGSGCIAIACAIHMEQAQVDASDISSDALAVAKINILRHHVEERVNLIQSDLFNHIPKTNYDIIISNPPYVNALDMATLPKEYHHEPQHALAAGEDGLDYATTILQQAADFLSPHGILIVEVGNSEHALIEKYPHLPLTWIEFERGDGGVFLITKSQLENIKISQK